MDEDKLHLIRELAVVDQRVEDLTEEAAAANKRHVVNRFASKDWIDYFHVMSPTILRVRGFRFYFFSREELRPHVHVQHDVGEAKFWLEPEIELSQSYGLKESHVKTAIKLIEEHQDEIRTAWKTHFRR